MADREVLQLLGPSTGGIRRHVAQLAAMLPDLGWSVEVAGPSGIGDGRALGPITEVPVSGRASPAAVYAARQKLRGPAGRADLVHAHGLKAGWVAAITPREGPLVVTVHNLVLDEVAGRSAALLRFLEGRLPSRVDAVVAVSDAIADRFGGPSAKVRVIPPAGPTPVPTRDRQAVRRDLMVDDGAPLVVCVARLHPQKDLGTLIDAVGLLRDRVPDVQARIVGEGPLAADLENRIAAKGLAGAVRLAGASTNAADELAAADVVAMTSLWESGPLVVSEALQLGRPLVSTAVGFVPRLVVDGVSGRLVPVGDAVAVADALEAMLRDPVGAAALGEEGRRRVEQLLSPDRLVAQVAGVYDELVIGSR